MKMLGPAGSAILISVFTYCAYKWYHLKNSDGDSDSGDTDTDSNSESSESSESSDDACIFDKGKCGEQNRNLESHAAIHEFLRKRLHRN